mmetsp:Transcript_10288/g.26751  ORF Transcript_10288/g.26751 Transcript_10288/m.26751 type:complete len:209 (-) Transcript_10288:2310-2936(-)
MLMSTQMSSASRHPVQLQYRRRGRRLPSWTRLCTQAGQTLDLWQLRTVGMHGAWHTHGTISATGVMDERARSLLVTGSSGGAARVPEAPVVSSAAAAPAIDAGGSGSRSIGGPGGGKVRGHQFARPRSPMAAGTSTVRMSSASIRTDAVSRNASSLSDVVDEKSSAPNAIAMIAPAAVMSGPELSSPAATDSRSLRPCSRNSRMRPSR